MADEQETEDPSTDALGDAGKKALDEERRARRIAEKKAKELSDRLTQLEDRDKSEGERLAQRLEAAEARSAKAERDSMRLRIAVNKGLDPKVAARLQGDTEDELLADADELLATFGTKKKTPEFDGGVRETAPAANGDPAAAFNSAFRGAVQQNS